MPRRDARMYLRDIVDACEAVVQILKVEPHLEVWITNARSISHFRNILIHTYDLVDPSRMWSILQDDVPLLRREAAALLAEREA